MVAVARDSAAGDLQLAVTSQAATLGLRAGQLPKILAGPDAVAEVAAWPCDIVLNAVTGAVGLAATLAALDAGRVLALANKESLIMGGPLVTVAGRSRPDRARRLRALGDRAVPAQRPGRRGAGGWW